MRYIFLFILFLLLGHSLLSAQDYQEVQYNINTEGEKNVRCGGVERWDEKVLADDLASQVNFLPVNTTMDSLIHIPTTPNGSAPRMPGIEFQTYTIKCFIVEKKNESDDDYHLVLKDGNKTMIGEVPDPTCSVASTSAHVDDFIAARNWVNLHIGVDPMNPVNMPAVDITGVAFVDVPHQQTGAAPNQMEIHPILNIHYSDNAGVEAQQTGHQAFQVNVNPTIFSTSTNFHLTSTKELFDVCRLQIFSSAGDKVNDVLLTISDRKKVDYTFYRNDLSNGVYIYRIVNNGSILYEGKLIIR